MVLFLVYKLRKYHFLLPTMFWYVHKGGLKPDSFHYDVLKGAEPRNGAELGHLQHTLAFDWESDGERAPTPLPPIDACNATHFSNFSWHKSSTN